MHIINKVFNPEIFQGDLNNKNYFEGWYFKIISKCHEHVWAIIPGISVTKNNSHTFIQLIDGISNKSYYFKYPTSHFRFSKYKFEILIDKNYFSRNYIELNLLNQEIEVKGSLSFHGLVTFPKSIFSPGIMGPFSFIPFMECYHGIVSVHHEIKGGLLINQREQNFSSGYGYIEKNWGKSFPKSWIWLQCNHFHQRPTSLMFSIAKIPFLKSSFIGFISFLKIKETVYTFATYSGAKVKALKYKENRLEMFIEDSNYRLFIFANLKKGGRLIAPENGLMARDIIESISSTVNYRLYSLNGTLIKEDYGINCGMEVCGDYTELSY